MARRRTMYWRSADVSANGPSMRSPGRYIGGAGMNAPPTQEPVLVVIPSLTKEIELGIIYTIYEKQAVLGSCHPLGDAKTAPPRLFPLPKRTSSPFLLFTTA